MPKYMMVYKGEATDMSDMTEEQQGEVMAKWGEWMQKVGSAITDVGAPLANGRSYVDDGTMGSATPLSGYTIVEAENADAAGALTAGHPFLSEGKGDFAVDVYELQPTPDM